MDNKKQDPRVPVWAECPFESLLLLKHPSFDWLKLENGAESSEHICLYIVRLNIHVEKSFQTLLKNDFISFQSQIYLPKNVFQKVLLFIDCLIEKEIKTGILHLPWLWR